MHPHDDRQDDNPDEEWSGSDRQEDADSFFLVDEDGRITSSANQADGGPLLWHAEGEPGGGDRSAGWFADFTRQPFALEERPERRPLISRFRDGAVIDAAYLAIVRCRGVMVGDHNRLISTYVYRIDQPQVDLAEMLKRPAVKEAMAAVIAADPESFKDARRHAEHVLTAGRWLPLKHALIDLRATDRVESDDLAPTLSALDGAIVIEDCKGLQVGSHNSQKSTFSYVCRDAAIDAVQLLSGNSRLAYALIDHVVGEGGARIIDEALSDSLLRSAEVRRLARPNGISWNGYRCGEIVERDGVAVGNDNTVRSTVKVLPAVAETRGAMLSNLKQLRAGGESAAAQAVRERRIAERERRIEEAERERRIEEAQREQARQRARVLAERQEVERREALRREAAVHMDYRSSDEIVNDLIKRQEHESRDGYPRRDDRDDRGGRESDWGGGAPGRF